MNDPAVRDQQDPGHDVTTMNVTTLLHLLDMDGEEGPVVRRTVTLTYHETWNTITVDRHA